MLIDLNSIAKACWEHTYKTNESPRFDDVEGLTSDNIDALCHYVGEIEWNESYSSFKQNLIEALKTLLTLAHIKQVNLNEFFNISLNINE